MILKLIIDIYKTVNVYDFKSMYLSVIMLCNISPKTIGSKRRRIPEDSDELEYVRTYEGHKITLEDTVVKFSSVTSGICADSVLFTVNKTTEVRNSDPLLASSLMVAANSMFGLLGYPHSPIYSPSCASSITTVASCCLTVSIRASQMLNCRIIYGDTDSIFIMSTMGVPIGDIGIVISRDLQQRGLSHVEMEREAHYARMIIMAKKRYCAIDGSGVTKLRGVSAVRSDTYGYVKHVSELMSKLLLNCEYNLLKVSLAVFISEVVDRLHRNNLTLYEASKYVKRDGRKKYMYRSGSGVDVGVEEDEAKLSSEVECDKTTVCESLGKELSRFTTACGTGTPGETVRDYMPLFP